MRSRAPWLAATACAALEGAVAAGTGSATDEVLQEIIVTGERQATTLSRTASSAAVATFDELRSMAGADRLEQALSPLPNVVATAGSEAPAIRGLDTTGPLRDLPAFLGGARPRATLQVDGRAMGFNEFVFGAAPLWDVGRIEVFRSPQTTTQGRNAIAGGIFMYTRDPTANWEADLRLISGDAHTRQGSFAVSGPLGNAMGVRVSGDLRRSRTSSRIADVFDGADPNRDDYGSVRVKLLAHPAGQSGVRLVATYAHSESGMPQIEGLAPPFEDRQGPNPSYGVFSTDVDSLTISTEYRLAPAAGVTTTLSAGDALIERHARETGPSLRLGQTRTRARDIALENVLSWQPAPAVEWIAGLHLARTRIEQFIDLTAVLGAGAFDDTQDSLGLFAQAQLQPWREWTITAGLRHQRDRQDRAGALAGPGTQYPIDYRHSFVATLPKLTITYAPTARLSAGLLVQRASNPGGVSYDFETGAQRNFGQETVWNHELFARMSSGRATARLNLFHNEFRHAQRALTRVLRPPGAPPVFWAEIANMPRARSRGLELEGSWDAGDRLQVRAAAGLLHTRLLRASPSGTALQGNRFQRAPGFSASAAVEFAPSARWRMSVQARHLSSYFSDDANTPELRVGASTFVDARVGLDTRHWSVFAYGRNLLDEFAITRFYSNNLATAADPRETGFGVELRLR